MLKQFALSIKQQMNNYRPNVMCLMDVHVLSFFIPIQFYPMAKSMRAICFWSTKYWKKCQYTQWPTNLFTAQIAILKFIEKQGYFFFDNTCLAFLIESKIMRIYKNIIINIKIIHNMFHSLSPLIQK